jgi:hypothetical protein
MTNALTFCQRTDILSGFRGQADRCSLGFVFAQFAVESTRRNAQNCGGSFAVSIACVEDPKDVFAFEFFQRYGCRFRGRRRGVRSLADCDTNVPSIEGRDLIRFDYVAQRERSRALLELIKRASTSLQIGRASCRERV